MARRLFLTVLIFVMAFYFSCSEKGEKESQSTSGALTNVRMWVPFDEGMKMLSREKKPVVIDFYTSWCKWCKVMDEKTFSDPQVRNYLARNFITIRLNAEDTKKVFKYQGQKMNSVQLTRHFGVRGYPSLAYLDSEGQLITVVPGYVPKSTFLPLLKYIKEGCYKKQISFQEFLERKQNCD